MKRSDLIICISLSVIYLLSPTFAESLCETEKRLRILSIFNLQRDVILQIASDDIYIGSIFYRINGSYDFGTRPVHKSILPEADVIQYEKDILPEAPYDQRRQTPLDRNRKIFGYVAPISVRYWEDCLNQTDPNILDKGCKELETVRNDRYDFICIHGSALHAQKPLEGNAFHVYIYDGETGALSFINDRRLTQLVQKSCTEPNIVNNRQNWDISLIPMLAAHTNWPEFGYKSEFFGSISIIQFWKRQEGRQPHRSEDMAILAKEIRGPLENSTYIETTSPNFFKIDKYLHIFQYNSYYKWMACGEWCNLDTKLEWLTLNEYNETASVFDLLDHYLSNITMRKLLGCPLRLKEQRFEPNNFCAKNRTFNSIFNLGKDLYFQSPGRFWQLPGYRFTDAANPVLKSGNKYQIRLESEFGAQLERNEFNTWFPVIGFTFKAPLYEKCKDSSDKECIESYSESGEYSMACLYGKRKFKTVNTPIRTVDHIYAYQYTAAGLSVLLKHFRTISDFCTEVFYMSFDGSEGLKSITSWEHTGDTNIIFSLFANKDRHLMRYEWPKNKLPVVTSGEVKYQLFDLEIPNLPIYVFQIGKQMWGYGSNMDGKLHKLNPSLNYFDPKADTELFSLLNCPFNSTVSLVQLKIDNVCEDHSSVESVFTIGRNLYHQIEQNFFVFDDRKKRFRYDRFASDLLNDYFDTTRPVTAFSTVLFYFPLMFQVIIHGKSHVNFEHLGEYIFGLFYVNDTIHVPFLKGLDSLYQNRPDGEPLLSLGVLDHMAEQGYIDFMGSLNTDNKDFALWVWIRDLKRQKKFEFMRDQEYIGAIFRKKDKDRVVRFDTVDYSRVPYEHVIGIYTDNPVLANATMYLIGHSKSKAKVMRYDMGQPFSVQQNLYDIKSMDTFTEIDEYYSLFCSNATNSTESESKPDSKPDSSNSSGTLRIIFILLLIALGILALVIVVLFLTKKPQKEHKTAESQKPEVETLDPNRPGHEVVRQQEPNASTGDESDEKSVRSTFE